MRNELVASRLAALETVEETLDAKQLTEPEAVAWLQSINSVRLVLGSLLDVSEELDIESLPDDHPEIEGFVLYGYLSLLLDELVHALEPTLSPRSRPGEARWRPKEAAARFVLPFSELRPRAPIV